MSKSLYDYCIENDRTELLAQWDEEKNGGLTPETIAPSSNKKVWWRCGKGHVWQAQISDRNKGTGCPICSHKKIMVGENDLATTHPEIARQWNYEKNGDLTPQDVFGGSVKKVWWVCDRGHEYFSAIFSRTSGCGCPVCSGQSVVPGENDLASMFPEIAAQWHSTKNGAITPENVTPFSNKKVWWQCELGHEYLATIPSRTKLNSGCPYCAGKKVLAGFNDLATKDPMLATQWYQDLNGDLTPEMVTIGSKKKAWWQCPNGHVWQTKIYSRATGRKHGCPVCAGVTNTKRAKRYKEMEIEDRQLNGNRRNNT